MLLQRTDQLARVGERLPQRGLDGFGLLDQRFHTGTIVVAGAVITSLAVLVGFGLRHGGSFPLGIWFRGIRNVVNVGGFDPDGFRARFDRAIFAK